CGSPIPRREPHEILPGAPGIAGMACGRRMDPNSLSTVTVTERRGSGCGTAQLLRCAASPVILRAWVMFESPEWTPDGAALIVKVLPEGDTIGPAGDSAAKADLALPNDS